MKNSKIIGNLLRKNTSKTRIAGIILSNFIGLLILCGGLQVLIDASEIWNSDDSFISSDFLLVNKKITSSNTFDKSQSTFSQPQIEDLRNQPWVRSVGEFSTADYEVRARISQDGNGMSTMMFLESLPDEYIDVASSEWKYDEGSNQVPLIIAKDYLTLYNFGFAANSNMPQLSEQLLSGVPLELTLQSDRGMTLHFIGKVVGFSNRLNTVLVPEEFLKSTNQQLGSHSAKLQPSRLIIDTSRPGDKAIEQYLDAHGLELSGDKNASKAAFFLRLISGIVLAIGFLITILSFFILLLSISLLMEKNRNTLHQLLMLGYNSETIAYPYNKISLLTSVTAMLLTILSLCALKLFYQADLTALGGGENGIWWSSASALGITIILCCGNHFAIRKKINKSWRM